MIRDATSWTFWTDVAQRSGWHWQFSNASLTSGEPLHRLVDPAGKVLQLGTREQIQSRWCELTRLDAMQERDSLAPVVLILHGLGRTRRSMTPLWRALKKRLPELEMHQYAYASMINRMDDHASSLAEYIAWSFGGRPIIFVAHSLGNIVLRRMYQMVRRRGGLVLPDTTLAPLCLLGHAMLGPPNQGSLIAKRISRMPGVPWIMGPSFLQVGLYWEDLRDGLDLPPGPAAVIAGDVPSLRKTHPLLPAPNDGLVLVDEARLVPDQEIEVYPIWHSLFMYDRRVHNSLARHIQNWLLPS